MSDLDTLIANAKDAASRKVALEAVEEAIAKVDAAWVANTGKRDELPRKVYKANAAGFNDEMARLQDLQKILRAGVPAQQIKP